jgi:phage FluMu protein Com
MSSCDSEEQPNPDPDDVRCECGRLLARKVPGGIELKCRRCGRLMRLTIELFGEVG